VKQRKKGKIQIDIKEGELKRDAQVEKMYHR
jgi:hypothetical protein